MFCTNCGRQIDDTAKFCDYCGTPTSDTDDAAPAQDRISTSPAAPQITVPASKPAGSGKVVTKSYHKPAIIVIAIIVVVAAAVIAIVAGLESHWNKKGDDAIETVQNSYFEFLPDITVGDLITAYYGEDYWTYNSDDVVEFFGTNQKDNTGLSIQFRQEDDHTVSVSDRMFRKADEASQKISEEEFESYMIGLYDQLDGSTAKADTTEAAVKTTAAKETTAKQTTTKATTTEVAKSKNYMAYADTIELYGGLADIAKNDYQESVAHREYYLYDIDQDGTQELLIRFGGSEADTETMVFTLDGDGTVADLGSFASGNTTLYQKDGKLYSSYAHMGQQVVSEIQIAGGSVTQEKVMEQAYSDGEQKYGTELKSCDLSDTDKVEMLLPDDMKMPEIVEANVNTYLLSGQDGVETRLYVDGDFANVMVTKFSLEDDSVTNVIGTYSKAECQDSVNLKFDPYQNPKSYLFLIPVAADGTVGHGVICEIRQETSGTVQSGGYAVSIPDQKGQINCHGGVVPGYTTDYIVNGGACETVRKSLGDTWHVTAKNKCTNYGTTWYELWDTDDNDYYGWVDSNNIDFY